MCMATYGHGGQVRYPHGGRLVTFGKPFVKGTSGFPAGRTKEQRARERALSDCILGLAGPGFEKYVIRLDDIATSGEPRDSIKAIEVLLVRAIGKPAETIVSVDDKAMTDAEYAAELKLIAHEVFDTMPLDEKSKLIDPAPSATIQ